MLRMFESKIIQMLTGCPWLDKLSDELRLIHLIIRSRKVLSFENPSLGLLTKRKITWIIATRSKKKNKETNYQLKVAQQIDQHNSIKPVFILELGYRLSE